LQVRVEVQRIDYLGELPFTPVSISSVYYFKRVSTGGLKIAERTHRQGAIQICSTYIHVIVLFTLGAPDAKREGRTSIHRVISADA
jgi:hypothetical protein